jgi:Xaa-Pro aminopeptidase
MPAKELPRLIYAASTESADLLYATKHSVPDPFIFLEQNGKRTIVLSDLEVDRGRAQAKADEILALTALEKPLEKRLKKKPALAQVLTAFLRQRRVRRARVPADFPLGLAQEIGREGIWLEPVEGLFWPERESKTAEELRLLQRSMRITEIGLARAMEVLRASDIGPARQLNWAGKRLTSEILRAEIDIAILRAGGVAVDTIVAGGDQACDPHERGSGPLRANSLIILDVFPRDPKTGYYGDLTRTVVRGQATEAQRKLWETVRQGQELALKGIRIGDSGKELQERVLNFFRESGYDTEIRNGRWTGFFHGLGHGLGLDLHEAPRIAATKFKKGQVFTVEPGLYFRGIGGVRIEDDGVVTENGFRVLSKFPKELEV